MHLARELMVKQIAGLPVAVLRPTLIYGAADTHNSYGPNRFRRMARKDKTIAMFGEGEETRDYICVDDAAAIIELALRHGSTGTLNLASGRSISFADLARKVAEPFETPIQVASRPRSGGTITHRAFDVSAIYRSFPTFQFTPLERGLLAAHQQDRS